MDRSQLSRKSLAELREVAGALQLRGYQRMRKADLVDLILTTAAQSEEAASESASPSGSEAEASTSGDTSTSGDASTDAGSAPAPSGDADQPAASPSPEPRARARARRRDEAATAPSAAESRVSDAPGDDVADRGKGSGREAAAAPSAPAQRDEPAPRSGHDAGRGEQDDEDARARGRRERRRKPRNGSGGPPQDSLEDAEVREGVLDLLPEGYGFLRVTGYLSGSRDVYVSQSFVRRFELRRGDRVAGPIRRNKNSDKFPALARVDTIEGEPVSDERVSRTDFKSLTPLYPDERLQLEVDGSSPMAMRLIDMMAPIGKGQRGLIVSPPKAGKTMLLKQLAQAIERNNPEVHLMVLLVDERPEEVTDFTRSTQGEVISSTFDRPAEDHTQVAELAIERAKRLVERGRDVVILLDSITRLARAYNLAAPTTGRILSGGLDSAALYPPKRFFGAARNIEGGGSLTIIATALIETGSKMDEVIFEEFKGTGNMELRLDRRMEQKRIFPAIDIPASGTRREELLLGSDELETVWKLRRLLATMDTEAGLQLLMDKLKATRSNAQFLTAIAKSNLQ